MNIAEIRNKTVAARAANNADFAAQFRNSPLREYIDKRINEVAEEGESELWLDFYATKKRLLGYKYRGPDMSSVIHHYQNEGFTATSRRDVANGSEIIALVISWM